MKSAHNPLYIEFVANLRHARKERGLTQGELGRLLSQPQAFVSKVETCERRLDLVEAAEWCIVLGITLSDVMPSRLRRSVGERPKEGTAP
jgi:transcriptional regulator with XRE-family HTH domain